MKRRSKYGDGSFKKELPPCRNVGELREAIKGLPADLPLHDMNDAVKPVWFNIGIDGEHLGFCEADDFS